MLGYASGITGGLRGCFEEIRAAGGEGAGARLPTSADPAGGSKGLGPGKLVADRSELGELDVVVTTRESAQNPDGLGD
jgi:hypothetical protein